MSTASAANFSKTSLVKMTPMKLLKLFILFGLSSELPAIIKTKSRESGEDLWPGSSVCALSLPPETKGALNDTEARNETGSSASNSSTLASLSEVSNNISIVRSGIQSSEALERAAAGLTASPEASNTSLKRAAPESRQDVASQAQAVSGTVAENHRHHGAHSNHKNYPNEPYSSASYAALSLHHSPPGAFLTGHSNSSPSWLEGAHSLLADREHHNVLETQSTDKLPQSSLSDQFLNAYASQPSYDESALNQALVSLATAAAMPSVTFNDSAHMFADPRAALNASLIQNLTASLFPVSKLSNATMLSLGELLSSRSRPASEHHKASLNKRPNELDQFDYVAGSSAYQQAAPSGYNLASSGQQANYLGALLSDPRFSTMLNLLASKPSQPSATPSQFGLREPQAIAARYRAQPGALSHRNNQQNGHTLSLTAAHQAASKESKFDSAQIVMGTRAYGPSQHQSKPSNVYNTYLPFKEGANGASKPMTNGQMLNMAAALYDNYLDQNYRYPLMAKHQQQQSLKDAPSDQSTRNSNQYEFIQHHNSPSQNHLDKIVYHSTPFRPSIVSPPQQQQQQHNGLHPSSANGTQLAGHQSYQRPKSEADSKSMSYATLGAHNQIAHGNTRHQADFGTTNSSRIQQQQQQQQQAKFEPMRQYENELDSIQDQLNWSPHSNYKQHQSNQTASSNKQQTQVGLNGTSASKLSAERPQGGAPLQQATSNMGPQLLLDLYERAIDNQILEAIYTDHQQHFQHLSPASDSSSLSAASPQTSASMSSQSSWPFDETLVSDLQTHEPSYSLGPGGVRSPSVGGPAPLGHQADQYSTLGAGQVASGQGGSTASASTSNAQSSLMDPLTSALQELPTFSASDLQPLLPASESSSMLLGPAKISHSAPPLGFSALITNGQSPAALADHSPDASSLASLVAQLFNPLPLSTGGASPAASNYNQLFAENEMAPSSYSYDSRPLSASQLQSQSTSPGRPSGGTQHSSGANSNLGLPALFAKLQTGQLSSILTSPFAHLYANLPRYRYSKPTKQSGPSTRHRNAHVYPHSASSKMSKQQAAAAMAATTAANLIAASGHTLTPLQAAMIQAQAATSAYLSAEPPLAEQADGQAASVEQGPGLTQASLSQQASNLALSSLASGQAGGGVSPQVWRNIMAPISWARKQTQTGGAANSSFMGGLLPAQQQNSYGSQLASQTLESPTVNTYHQAAPLARFHPHWDHLNHNNQLSFNNLFSTATSQTQLTTSPLTPQAAGQPTSSKGARSRLKIKILKIPVAFYDTSAASDDATAASGATSAPHMSPMPVHLQPGLTASLLAGLSCPHHAHRPQTSAAFSVDSQPPIGASTSVYPAASLAQYHSLMSANQQLPHRLDHFVNQYRHAEQLDSPSSGMKQVSTSARTSPMESPVGQSTSGPRPAPLDKLTPIRDFTDINQPNDLQVSPSGTTGPLSTALQQRPIHLAKSS